MKRKKWISAVLSLAMAGSMVFSLPAVYAADTEHGGNTQTIGTTYYVDSKDGSDKNDGTSQSEAFKSLDMINQLTLEPGDQVLLKKGSVFDKQYLHVQGSGSEGNPIIISTYGEGERPVINADGTGLWYQDYGKQLDDSRHVYQGYVSSAVLLKDVEYIEIRGLEITNDRERGPIAQDEGKPFNARDIINRTGVAGFTQNIGTADHIVVDDLYIHDVDGNVYDKHMLNGGIYFATAYAGDNPQNGIPRYNDLQITNCHVEDVNRWGIAAAYTAYTASFKGVAAISDADIAKYGSSNVVIRNNYVKNAGGDAITAMYCDRGLVENNVADAVAQHMNNEVYTATTFGNVSAGIWPWKCKNTVFQYNEAFDICANGDGQAWDADSGDGTLYQYNYSHNNAGGPIMFCYPESIHNTFRYNISYLDLEGLNPSFNVDAHVYNNVFYMKENVDFIRTGQTGGNMVLENNIIYNSGKTAKNEQWHKGVNANNFKYDNNLYYNYGNLPSNEQNAIVVTEGTPVFADETFAGVPTKTDGAANPHNDPAQESVFDAFKLADESPAVNKGKVITDANGYAVDVDFFGKKVGGVPEIGAAESDVVSLMIRSDVYNIDADAKTVSGLAKNTTVKELKSNLIYDSAISLEVKNAESVTMGEDEIVKGNMTIVLSYEDKTVTYTIVANSDNALKSTSFMVTDKTIYVPSTANNPTTVGALKSDIEVHETATVSVVGEDGSELQSGPVEADMILRITAENGDTNDYKIGIDNVYQWVQDYVHGQQGNVWFGQVKTTTSDWSNITKANAQYPNWEVATWYGPGVEGNKLTGPYDESLHGLISAPAGVDKGNYEGTAMAFRAPKTGTVKFEIKSDEPYLRQSPNTGGSTIITLTVNGQAVRSVTLTDSFVQGEFPAVGEIKVEKGDWIRVEASVEGSPTKGSVFISPTITYLDEDTPLEDTEAPAAPADVRVSDVQENSFYVNWSESKDNVDVAGYNVYVNGEKMNEELLTAAGFTVEGLAAGTEYSVVVEAVDTSGNKTSADAVKVTTAEMVDADAPTAPANVTASDVTKDSFTLNWKASQDNVGVAGYNVYVDGTKVNDGLITETAYTVKGLKAGTAYTVVIEAVDAAGNVAESEAKTVTTLKEDTTDPGTDPGTKPDPDKKPGTGGNASGNTSDKMEGADKDTPKTGDNANMLPWAIGVIGAAGVLTVLAVVNGRKKRR